MAMKVALTAALLVALLAIAGATTVTTTTSDANSGLQHHEQCGQQLQGRQFRACQRYLSQSSSQGEGPYLEMVTRGQQGAKECCQSLKEVEQQQPQCGCEAIKKALQQGTQMGLQAYQRAQQLPQMCNMRTQQCQIYVIFV